MDEGNVTALALLDLSAAFDTEGETIYPIQPKSRVGFPEVPP